MKAVNRRQATATVASLASAALVSPWARAQDKYPSRPISLICPWTPGGASDAAMRAIGESLGRRS
jgi:tripartite-type tricarboxylate transporter receptor subunit TctC